MLLLIKYTLLYGIVLMLVALGGMFSEHSGVINIALEGIMVVGGLAGVLVTASLPTTMAPALIVLAAVVALTVLPPPKSATPTSRSCSPLAGWSSASLSRWALCCWLSATLLCIRPALACACAPAASTPRQRIPLVSTSTACAMPVC